MNKEIRLIEGKYTYWFVELSMYEYYRPVMYIIKGGERVGFIVYHPAAKQLVFNAETALTKKAMKEVCDYLNEDLFYELLWSFVEEGLLT